MRNFLIFGVTAMVCGLAWAEGQTSSLPNPAHDAPLAKTSTQQYGVFAGGCFWGIQAVFQHTKGVISATSGYAGGAATTAEYEAVSTGATGHAESVKVAYDPSKISYGQLLKVYFAVAHNPTELNRQGPDTGTQYRSEIFTATPEQKQIADSYITQLEGAHAYPKKIVTRVSSLNVFYPAEAYHQNYAELHPYNPYIAINDRPKIEHLKKQFPDLYK